MGSRTTITTIACLLLTTVLTGCMGRPALQPRPAGYELGSKAAESAVLETSDNLLLFGQWWLPQTPAKATILLVHGTGLHSGFYSDWAEFATEHGYAVFGVDLRGWGQSQGYGRRGYALNYERYFDDLRVGYEEVKGRYPDLPVFIQGESLGGAMALLAEIRGVENAGLVLNAPAVHANPGLGSLRAPGWMANFGLSVIAKGTWIWPNYPTLPMTNAVAKAAFVDFDPAQRYIDDPFCTHTFLPAIYITNMTRLMEDIRANYRYIQTPVLVQHGTSDRLVPVSSSEKLVHEIRSGRARLITYEGQSHGALHGYQRKQVWQDAIEWLDGTLALEQQKQAISAH